MAGARFVFVSDCVDEDDQREKPVHRVWWRLVAANNRVLGRSADTYLGEDTCRAKAADLCRCVDIAVAVMTTGDRGEWMWTLALDDVPMAESAHPFARRVDSMRALKLLIQGLHVADPYAGSLRIYAAGRNRHRLSFGGPDSNEPVSAIQ